MAYLIYTTAGVQLIRDEKMYEFKKTSASVLARFPLSEVEAEMTLDELMKIYPPPERVPNGN